MCPCVSVSVWKGGGGGVCVCIFFLLGGGIFSKRLRFLFYFASLTWTLLPWRFLFHAKVGEMHAHLANLVSVSFRLVLLSF